MRLIDLVAKVEIRGMENLPKNGAFSLPPIISACWMSRCSTTPSIVGMSFPGRRKMGAHRFSEVAGQAPKLGIHRPFQSRLEGDAHDDVADGKGPHVGDRPRGYAVTRRLDDRGKPGASYLAAKMQVPIVPIGLSGTEDRTVFANLRKLRRSPVLINAGKPFRLPPLRDRSHPCLERVYGRDHVPDRRPDPRAIPASMPNIPASAVAADRIGPTPAPTRARGDTARRGT